MKIILIWLLVGIAFLTCKRERPDDNGTSPTGSDGPFKDYNKDIRIANWNIEWFGDPSGFHGNLNDQELNAAKVLKYLDADLYGLCEIVDTTRFGRMIRNNLGDDFRYTVSFFTGGMQKMAFVYNRHIFRNVSVRPFMAISAPAYYNFGNRYPYLLQAEVSVNGAKKEMSFLLIHAKADDDLSSYNRRLNGALELKDSLDTYYNGKYFMILGDFNDNFDKSIIPGKISPYRNFLDDAVRYNAITAPLNIPGNQSSLGYANSVIDQQVISSNMTNWYLPASAQIRTDVVNAVPGYSSGNTSDHYPVTSVYRVRP
ncbi:exonuclease/endonuclease/phosphatase family protein [Niabella hibiscisoli]|uniref:endonuclease/exonuclease/phosphatase n=1 Tax=Niabella hibiscisoli TaxID=1825928 RepID=UPI001F0F8A9B|nr:endonuclease/exonuclease/phosphatase [Niabella hibiscisoli]MCH5718459.1 endonuclease/exonuclease/phosphatase [Niabella hibiscisoli]